MLEPFSIISQSLTLSNRLSINILAGSLSISSLSVAVIVFSIYLIIKIGFLSYSIEGLGQPPSAGFGSIILQCKEFSYSYFNLTDSLIGSIFYLTTGLHGFHVLIGSFLFYSILFYILFSSIYPFYFMEFSFPLFLSSHH